MAEVGGFDSLTMHTPFESDRDHMPSIEYRAQKMLDTGHLTVEQVMEVVLSLWNLDRVRKEHDVAVAELHALQRNRGIKKLFKRRVP